MLSSNTSAVAGGATYVDDVFSTYIYKGTGATLSITNDIDLSTKGGLVWIKQRTDAAALGGRSHFLFDTTRGVTKDVNTNETASETTTANSVTAFNTNGYTLGSSGSINSATELYASWTFAKQAKFFDIVTYTGNGSNRTISHNLGSIPGCIMVKRTSGAAANWQVYHRTLANTQYLQLNTTGAPATGATRWNSTTPTSSDFSIGTDVTVNSSGDTYVAYLFAHDAGGFGLTGTDNVISCGTFTTSAGGTATVSLGYEPQFLMIKKTNSTGNWFMFDTIRQADYFDTIGVSANLVDQETNFGAPYTIPTATGFNAASLGNVQTYAYVSIRKGSMKVPTDATKVFSPVAYTGTGANYYTVNTGVYTDMVMARIRTATSAGGFYVADRLRGDYFLATSSNPAETKNVSSFMTTNGITGLGNAFAAMNGFGAGPDATRQLNVSGASELAYAFRRAPSFFDMVCYRGTGSAQSQTHNLGVVPELMILKSRQAGDWRVYDATNGNTKYTILDGTAASATASTMWNDTSPTASVFTVGTVYSASATEYVAYLFATCAGVSKVGSYIGTGTTKQVDCGFVAGARFVLIKRTDSTGDWYVWDTSRGIVSGNDPYSLVNTTAAEVTSTDYIDAYSAGFEISSTAPAAVNASGGTFIFLAIA